MKHYYFYFKNDNSGLVYNHWAKNKQALKLVISRMGFDIKNLVIDG